MNIPDTKLRNAKPKDKNYRIQIGGNTYLEVLTTGHKVWRMRYNKPDTKKPAFYTIGDYPDITQKQARNHADEAKALLKGGIDPATHRKQEAERIGQERRAALQARADSFESVARAWHKHRLETLKKWKQNHADKILSSLEDNAFPFIGALPIADVTAPRLLEVIQTVIDRGTIETAKKLNQRINSIMRYAVTRKMALHNEADNLKDEIPTAKGKHHPHLKADEIRPFINAVEDDPAAGEVVRIAILLTLHTLARTNEVRFAKWSEFDMRARLWTIPAERMKMQLTHVIPLSNQAVELLERLRMYNGIYDYLFVTRNSGKPMSENAMLFMLYRIGYKGRLTIHGLRGTGSTILNETGFRGDVIEVALAHKEKNAIRGAYNHALYLEERRDMLQWYSDHLDALKAGAQIIPIRRKPAKLTP